MLLRKLCPTCGLNNAVTSVICSCGASLVKIDPSEVSNASQQDSVLREATEVVDCRECGASIPTSSERCVYCGAIIASTRLCRGPTVHVEWPWGACEVNGTLTVGREAPTPAEISKQLTVRGHDNVSRRHAEFSVTDGKAWIIDLGSTNGTFVDDVRLIPQSPMELTATHNIRFGADLTVVVTVE